MPYYPEDRDLVTNNLKHILKEKKITMIELSDHLKVTQQQVSKYAAGINAMGINTLLETCKLLDCTPLQIYPQLDLSGNTKLMPTDTDKNVKLNQNIVVENYGFSYHVVNFFKNIVVVDFLTLNRKVVLLVLVLMNIAFVAVFYLFSNLEKIFPNMNIDVANTLVSDIGYGLDLIFTGLLLPLLIRSWLAYTPLAMGLWVIEAPIYLYIYGTIEGESNLHFYGVLFASFFIAFLYSFLVKSLRKKYLKNTGRN
jgi:DNA-binding Xre family transcriptional regulator